MLFSTLLYVFLGVAIIQITYYLFFGVFAFRKPLAKKKNVQPVSVLVCAKNEDENLKKNVPALIGQDHPEFEIILINDSSSDNTLEVMKGFEKQYENIRVVDVKPNENFWGNKKYALTLGIKTASYDQLLFTDADCTPASKNWIQEMANHFGENKSLVLGYGKYETSKITLLNMLVAYETVLTAIQYFSYALLRNPYMAVGRNLAYRKEEFYKTKGFIKHIQHRSGDDDLFIQEAANRVNTTISEHPDSFTISEPLQSLTHWYRQKRRHVSTAIFYKPYHKFLLGLFFLSKLLFWILLPIIFIFHPFPLPLIVAGIYLLITLVIVGYAAQKLDEKKVIWVLPFLDLFLVLNQFAIFIANLFFKPTHWK